MNWITTNIRLPEDLYMDLKLKAARERRSIASVIRDKLSVQEERNRKEKTKKILRDIEKLRVRMEKENPGINFSEALIKMRYEQ